MHALLDAGFRLDGHAEELDPIAEVFRGIEIGERDRGDTFDVDGGSVELGAESEARQDGELLRGVVTFDIERRIGLGVPQPLRFAGNRRRRADPAPCARGCNCRCR
jgi:hypothetical protein